MNGAGALKPTHFGPPEPSVSAALSGLPVVCTNRSVAHASMGRRRAAARCGYESNLRSDPDRRPSSAGSATAAARVKRPLCEDGAGFLAIAQHALCDAGGTPTLFPNTAARYRADWGAGR